MIVKQRAHAARTSIPILSGRLNRKESDYHGREEKSKEENDNEAQDRKKVYEEDREEKEALKFLLFFARRKTPDPFDRGFALQEIHLF